MLEQSALEHLIQTRRTPNPALFLAKPIEIELLKRAIDIARYAPNHKRTEPARFYFSNDEQKQQMGNLFYDFILEHKGEEQAELALKNSRSGAQCLVF